MHSEGTLDGDQWSASCLLDTHWIDWVSPRTMPDILTN